MQNAGSLAVAHPSKQGDEHRRAGKEGELPARNAEGSKRFDRTE